MIVSKLSQTLDPTKGFLIPSSEVRNTSLDIPSDASRTRSSLIEQILASDAELYFQAGSDSLYAVTSVEIGEPFEVVITPQLSQDISIGSFKTKEKYVWGAAGLALGALVLR